MEEAAAPITEPSDKTDKATIAKLVVAVALVAIVVIFAVQNTNSLDVEFLAWSFAMPRILLMLLSAVIGIVIWELAGLLRRRSRAKAG